MNDEELDVVIATRFKAYEAGIRLPEEFKGRFVGSVRRKRTLRRIGMLGLICATVVASVVIVNFAKRNAIREDAKPVLMAHTAPTNETTIVSYWMLFGYLRECLSRSRSARRKEDE